jgi:hypothetical protein
MEDLGRRPVDGPRPAPNPKLRESRGGEKRRMKLYFNKSRVALAALLSLLVAVVALVVGAAPAVGMAFSSVGMSGHRVAVPVQGSGSPSPAGWVVVAAILTATVAFALVGWGQDRRSVAKARQADLVPDEPVRPSASKPLPMRTAPAVRARRDQRAGEQSHKSTI